MTHMHVCIPCGARDEGGQCCSPKCWACGRQMVLWVGKNPMDSRRG